MSGVEVSVETRGATVDLGGRDLTPSDTAEFESTRLAATRSAVFITVDVDSGALGQLTVSVPTEAMVDLLMKLAEARS